MTLKANFTDATLSLDADLGEVQTVQTVKPISVNDQMTQPVGVDSEGRLFTIPTVNGKDGFSPIVDVEHTDIGVILKITDKDGITTAATIANGKDGKNGKDGHTPQLELSPIDNGVEISVTTPTGGSAAFIYDGKSAYEYAKEGGYTGTEEEFAVKLASETSGIHIGTDAPTDGSDFWVDTDEEADSGKNSGGSASIDVAAEIGQTIVVEEVDENGKPTKWRAADYQPRTHWTEDVLIYHGAFELTDGAIEFEAPFNITIGEMYKVIWNGTVYTCKATDGAVFEVVGGRMLGNTDAITGVGDSGEPFVIGVGNGYCAIVALDGATTINLSIALVQCTPIPAQYLSPAFPYYIEVSGSGTTDDPLTISETVSEIREIYNSGRTILVRLSARVNKDSIFYLDYHLMVHGHSLVNDGFSLGFANMNPLMSGADAAYSIVWLQAESGTETVTITYGSISE